MLRHTSHKPDEIVGHMRPTHFREYWEYTVEKVAVNAVMAGARPEYFPVILALAASGVSARGSTTSSAAAMAVVNGPIRNEIGMNCGIGAMGPYNHANATIGRAWGLLSPEPPGRLGARPDLHGLAGQQLRLQQHHVRRERGAQPLGAVPRAARLQADGQHGQRVRRLPLDRRSRSGCASSYWREHVRNMLRGMDPHSAPMLLLDPITARQFIDRGGFDTKEKLIDWIHENATHAGRRVLGLPARSRTTSTRARPSARSRCATKLKAAPDELIPMFPRGRDPRGRRRRRDQRLLADHGRRLPEVRLGRRLALTGVRHRRDRRRRRPA